MAGELITADWQVEWRGVLLGSGTAFRTDEVTGWFDLPDTQVATVDYSSRHGGYPGQERAARRRVTWNFKVLAGLAGFAAASAQLRAVTALDEQPVEEPLVIRIDGLALRCKARVTRRQIPTDQAYALGYTKGAVVWEASDPRIYSAVEKVYTASLAVAAGGGLDFGSGGLDFGSGGLDFGSAQQGGLVSAVNAGHVASWPVIEIDGPVTGPGVVFADAGGRRLTFKGSWSVLPGQTVVIDTYRRNVQVFLTSDLGNPDAVGVPANQQLQVRQWTSIPKQSTSKILFSAAAYDPAARMRVRVRDAYM